MNPKTILGRYLTKQIVFNFLAVLLMVLGVVLLFEVIELLRRTSGRDDASFGFVMQMAFTKLPRTVDMVFPFVMMIAAMITFWKLSKSNEFVIIRAAGVSIWGINPISARMYELYETLDFRLKTRNPEAVLFNDIGLWLREAGDENTVVVLKSASARQEKDSLFMREVTILELDRNSQPLKRIEAFAATLDKDHFDLKDVRVFEPGQPTQTFANLPYKTTMTLERIKESFVEPDSISFWELPGIIHFYEMSGFSALKHRMRYLSLVVSPFLLCAMVLVAAVFALRPNNRRGGIMFLIVGGISTGFVVYFLSQVIYAFGLNGDIPALFAVWTPTLIAALISISILLHLEDG